MVPACRNRSILKRSVLGSSVDSTGRAVNVLHSHCLVSQLLLPLVHGQLLSRKLHEDAQQSGLMHYVPNIAAWSPSCYAGHMLHLLNPVSSLKKATECDNVWQQPSLE